ncbi:MAG TPA: hypothetical protein PKD20_03560 [Candidatus Saccharibacteria bacterium]|mgnify:CR=1 FL=1|jgi:hypothetical protein|nr:hypothetical protein [Candidatus Saccharibacteria bacterium]HMT55929.1 hypothetical protein [Candidatus Saccharibacteria bacterium]
MTAKEYIQAKLEELSLPAELTRPANVDDLERAIFKILMSKKFRKYSANDALQTHVKEAIHLNVSNNQPINITFLHGAYKLWRLKETPEVDWAELFALMYYTNWVKGICEIYEPGVLFDFYVDDYIINRLDNIPMSDVYTYISSYQSLMTFLRPFQPDNFSMTITTVGSQFSSEEAFNESLQKNLEKLTLETPTGLPDLTYEQRAMVELNTKATNEQLKDPMWREKVYHLHNAYLHTKAEPGYHKGRPEKIMAFTQPLPSGMTISVGTTKSSIMKFWIGVGVLQPKGESFKQLIISPSQLEKAVFHEEKMQIKGLIGKNFSQIRILN